VVAVLVVALLLLAGCTDEPARGAKDGATSGPAPELGGPEPAWQQPPRREMDRLEKPVASRLARQISAQGLTLVYLDCPRWDGTVPRTLTCRGYVDGVVTDVRLLLKAAVDGKVVGFDARLGPGLVATQKLEEILRRQGWADVDCGDLAVYPATVGTRIVCKVERGRKRSYVAATVRSHAGAVTIADYAGAGGAR
jgi:hypothetical protein